MKNNNDLSVIGNLKKWITGHTYQTTKENPKLKIINQLEGLGYKVSTLNEEGHPNRGGWYATLIAKKNETGIAVNLHNPFFMYTLDGTNIYGEEATSIVLVKTFELTISSEGINQRFLEELNKANAKFMFTKVFYRENDEKEITLYISTCVFSYSEKDLENTISFLESDTNGYRDDLKGFTDFKS